MNTCSIFSKFQARVNFFYLLDRILRAWNSFGSNTIVWEDRIWNASEKKLRKVSLFYMQLRITDLLSTVQVYKVFSYTAVALWLSCPCPWYSANQRRAPMCNDFVSKWHIQPPSCYIRIVRTYTIVLLAKRWLC